jgi:hypothetical protein
MRSDISHLIQVTVSKGLPMLLSFLDDALLLALTRIGIQLPWLSWLSGLLLSATVLYWSWRILHRLYQKFSSRYQ